MKITISEMHFIIRQVRARIEWIHDNPDDFSIEEDELNCLKNVLNKLKEQRFEFLMESTEEKER